jgi:hypothetical protein
MTAVKVTVNSDVEEDISKPDAATVLFPIPYPHSSVILEDCVFETAVDSPVMFDLLLFKGSLGGQVGSQDCGCDRVVQSSGATGACSSCHLLHIADTALPAMIQLLDTSCRSG